MILKEELLFEKLLMNSEQVPKDSDNNNLQLWIVAVKVEVLVLEDILFIFNPVLELVKLAQF